MSPDIDMSALVDKLHPALKGVGIMAIDMIRDSQTGQVQWSTVFTGVLTAGLIAAASSIIALNSKVTELAALASQRAASIDNIPAMQARQENVIRRLDSIESGNALAVNDRFRAADAQRMELRLETLIAKDISRIESRIEREVLLKGSRR